MNNYNIIATTETEKYKIMQLIRDAGATVTGVSGYGTGYYIQLTADPLQVQQINNALSGRIPA